METRLNGEKKLFGDKIDLINKFHYLHKNKKENKVLENFFLNKRILSNDQNRFGHGPT